MNNLIEIKEQNGQQLVSARNLHEFLEVTERFQQWFDKKVEKYNFKKNKDFIGCKVFHALAKQEIQDYLLTLPMAKEISMIQNNEKGKQARQYFIKCEEAWNSEDMILSRALEIQNKKVLTYKEHIEELETKIQEDAPRVAFAESIEKAADCILVREFSKVIATEGIYLGERKLYKWFREKGHIFKNSTEPMQTSVEKGLFKVSESTIQTVKGDKIIPTTKITGKGQIYFLEKLKKEFGNRIVS